MSVTIGTKFGSYEITAPIGAGGMGEVYRARDLKLRRDVALKVLPEAFSSDPKPHASLPARGGGASITPIAHIYGLEESGEVRCIVMELVEGETLQDANQARCRCG